MDNPLKGYWGNRTDDDVLFQVASDFVGQLEEIMKSENIGRSGLARKLGITRGRVSQILNDPGNLTLRNIVKYARVLGQSVSVVTYERAKPSSDSGPIPPQVFVACWRQAGNPTDMFSVSAVAVQTSWSGLPPGPLDEEAETEAGITDYRPGCQFVEAEV